MRRFRPPDAEYEDGVEGVMRTSRDTWRKSLPQVGNRRSDRLLGMDGVLWIRGSDFWSLEDTSYRPRSDLHQARNPN